MLVTASFEEVISARHGTVYCTAQYGTDGIRTEVLPTVFPFFLILYTPLDSDRTFCCCCYCWDYRFSYLDYLHFYLLSQHLSFALILGANYCTR